MILSDGILFFIGNNRHIMNLIFVAQENCNIGHTKVLPPQQKLVMQSANRSGRVAEGYVNPLNLAKREENVSNINDAVIRKI